VVFFGPINLLERRDGNKKPKKINFLVFFCYSKEFFRDFKNIKNPKVV
jgi:hypothetical protein